MNKIKTCPSYRYDRRIF